MPEAAASQTALDSQAADSGFRKAAEEAGGLGVDDATRPIGFGAAATGGAGGSTVTVTTATGPNSLTDYATRTGSYIIQVSGTIALPSAVFIKSNKTIVGIGMNPTISGARIQTDTNHGNLIFQNLRFLNSTPLDAIAVRYGGHDVWIDHCSFTNAADECIDVSNGGDKVTISWCKFTFSSGTGQKYPILIGGSDDDPATYHVTVHHNWFASGCNARMPRCRKGQIHVFNNYFDCAGNTEYCVLVALESEVRLENNYFNGVKYPWRYYTLAGQVPGKCLQTGNILVDCTLVDTGGNDAVFTPRYSYSLQGAAEARAAVIAGTGPIQSPADSARNRIVNLSVRANAGSGDDTLIVGFAIGGSGSTGALPILARGIGPALSLFGVVGYLPDPAMIIFTGSTEIARNDNWAGATEIGAACARVRAFALMDPDSRDAAIYNAGMAPGAYTIHIAGTGVTPGIALAEVYDAKDSFSTSTHRLVNVSARTYVGSGENVLIAGFVIAGNTPKAILLRGVGPTLRQFGVGNILADPELRVFDSSNQQVAENDDWGGETDLESAFSAVRAFPLAAASKDAAIAAMLLPGSYTAHLRGVNGSSGVALVEVYELP